MEVATLLIGWGWSYDELRRGWSEIEALGYDTCYMGDDLFPHPKVDLSVYDPWTILPAMAATTTRMRIGSLVSPAGRRHPGVFAKTTSITDVISGGRLIVGMGAGNAPEQQRSVGQPYPGPAERTQMLREELAILRSMWTNPRTSFAGSFYDVTDAINEPKPGSLPEILVALKNKTHLPSVAAEFADRVNALGADDCEVAELIAVITQKCRERKRNASDITFSRPASVVFTDDAVPPDDVDRVLEERAALIGANPVEMTFEHRLWVLSYVGPPQGCAEAITKRTLDLGFNEIVICIDTIGANAYERTMCGLRTFAQQVMPALQRR